MTIRQGDLFARWYITTPPGASHQVLMWGTRVMAQGSLDTLRLNYGYRLTRPSLSDK